MSQLIIVADYGDLCGEGPLWDAEAGALYWTDCVGLKFYRYRPAANQHEIIEQGLEINGAARDASGGFAITNNSGIWYWDGNEKLRLIAEEADGTECQMNDCIADPRGRLFAGSWFYDPGRSDYPLGKLVRMDLDGTARIVDEGIHLANGLAFLPTAERSTSPIPQLGESMRTITTRNRVTCEIAEPWFKFQPMRDSPTG